MSSLTAERASLAEWREIFESRDTRILAAIRAGIPKTEIHRLTGVARTTIDDIIERNASDDNPRKCA